MEQLVRHLMRLFVLLVLAATPALAQSNTQAEKKQPVEPFEPVELYFLLVSLARVNLGLRLALCALRLAIYPLCSLRLCGESRFSGCVLCAQRYALCG